MLCSTDDCDNKVMKSKGKLLKICFECMEKQLEQNTRKHIEFTPINIRYMDTRVIPKIKMKDKPC